MRYHARDCFSYWCFIPRATRLFNNLTEQGYKYAKDICLKSSLNKFYCRHGDLMLIDIVKLDHIQWHHFNQTLSSNSIFGRNAWGFHRAFGSGVACNRTPPYTWSNPMYDLHALYILTPILLPSLSWFSGICTWNTLIYFHEFALFLFYLIQHRLEYTERP